MNDEINVDFEKLNEYILELQNLVDDMEEPSYDKTEFWTGGVSGSGIFLDELVSFCNDTIQYHKAVRKLIKYSVNYLNRIKELQKTDTNIANLL